ncbi:MAG: alkaline phosphatase D family protein [Kineosporiaceae bacterium]
MSQRQSSSAAGPEPAGPPARVGAVVGGAVLARRAVVRVGAVIAGVAAGVVAWRRPSTAGTTPTPHRPPSFTTTSGAPVVIAAHAGILRPAGATPVPGAQRLQVVVHASEPCTVKVQVRSVTAARAFESTWTPTTVGLDRTNPVNAVKILMPEGCGAPGQVWTWSVLLAPPATAPAAPPSAATFTDPRVRTLPMRPAPGQPSSFKVATGSCSQVAHVGQPLRRVPAAAAMATAGLTEFVHLGDTSYVDTWTELDESTAANRYTKFAWGARMHVSQSDFAALYAKVPTRTIIDDHDAGPDDCYALNTYPEARQVLTDCFAGSWFDEAGFDLDHPSSVSYDHWSIGEADFFLLDNRFWRDGGGRRTGVYGVATYPSQLGDTQQRWLISALRSSSAPIKIIYCPRTFRHFYAKGEQDRLLDVITGKDGGPAVGGVVVFASGDMHAAAITRLDRTAAVYEVQCAPIANTTLHTLKPLFDWQVARGYSLLWLNTADGKPGQAASNAWGEFEINTLDPSKRTLTVRLRGETGAVLKELVIPVPSGTPSPSPTTTRPTSSTTTTRPTSSTTTARPTSSTTTARPTSSTTAPKPTSGTSTAG